MYINAPSDRMFYHAAYAVPTHLAGILILTLKIERRMSLYLLALIPRGGVPFQIVVFGMRLDMFRVLFQRALSPTPRKVANCDALSTPISNWPAEQVPLIYRTEHEFRYQSAYLNTWSV